MAAENSSDSTSRYEQYNRIASDLREAYLADQRPWVVGFSGGKDSTALLEMVWYVMIRLPESSRRKPVYVLASDTRVETPLISKRIGQELRLIQEAAFRDKLPVTTRLVYPKLNDTFWVNLIGRGYPSPNNKFRWCTERLKIKPVSEFIRNTVNRSGEVVVVLGARKQESSTRSQTMNAHALTGNRFRPHADLPRAWVYTPIEELTADDIWVYLLQVPNPWGGDNKSLLALYRQASGGECPLVIDTTTPSCGQSRFGCWACTVVDRDKSMESLVDNGEDHLEPLLELRDYLRSVRDEPGARYNLRRNGTVPVRRGSDEVMTNIGPFTHKTRSTILRKLLVAQKESGIILIGGDELAVIEEIWSFEEQFHPERRNTDSETVASICLSILGEGKVPDMEYADHQFDEDRLLEEVCEEMGISFEMIQKLRETEEEFGHLRRRRGLPDQMREIIQAAVTEEECET